jgi:hypothetical protein
LNARTVARLLVSGLLPLAPALVLAQPARAPLDLGLVAPEGCPTASAVVDEVTRITGGAGGASRHVTARVRVEKLPNGAYQTTLQMRIEDASEETRSFEAESCAAAADAATLILAIAVNPLVSLSEPPRVERPTPPPPPPPPVPPPPAKRPEAPVPTPPPPPRLALGAAFAADAGTLSAITLGAEVRAAWTPARFRFELHGSAWAPGDVLSLTHRGVGAHFDMFGFGARAGYEFPVGPLRIGPVLGAMVTYLEAEGFGGTATLRQRGAFFAPFAGAALVWPLGRRFSLRVLAGVSVPTQRPSFSVRNADTGAQTSLLEVAPAAGHASLGVDLPLL